jgi:hypothetical protein
VKSQPHLKRVVVGSAMYGYVVVVLNIGKTLIPGAEVLGIVHVKYVHDHLVYNPGLTIHLGVEGSGLGELGVQK